MKMTLWRRVSLWLSVVLLFGHLTCNVGCTEPDQEAQDVSFEEETREHKPHLHKEDGSLALPPPPSANEQSQEDESRPGEQTTQAAETEETLSENAVKNWEPSVDAVSDVQSGGSPPETAPEQSPNPDVSTAPDPESVMLISSSDAVLASTPEENGSPAVLEDDFTASLSDDWRHEVLPPAACEEESNPYDHDRLPPVVLENMSNAHTAGTKTQADPSAASQAGPILDGNMSRSLEEQAQGAVVTTDTDPSVTSKDPGQIPTFNEWKQKVLENEKTQTTHTSANGVSGAVRKVQKNFNNYASVECGAKILGANPEAKSTSAILKENMDLYMLNPCSHKIWFIIELCEPVQVKQLDIANFELFSSTPKDFLVSISDRYPTNKWLKLGTFHARDERTVQSFPLDEHLYAKYVKVELLSHFGSEHFCPLSLIRVFGTSMVEEYEEIADPSERPDDQDDDLDYPSGYGPGEVKNSKNLIGSAKDVILNMVNNIAVNVLGGNSEMQGNVSSQDGSLTERDGSESTTQTPITDATTVSELEEATVFPDAITPQTSAPTALPELLAANISEQQPPPLEEQIVIPLEPDEEESISSTITLLEKEDEFDEEREKMDANEPQNVCALFPSCSCAASLWEYLQQRCLFALFQKRKCQPIDRKQIAPATRTPTWPPPSLPSVCPESKQHHGELHEPSEKEQAPAREPERGAGPSEAPQPPENAVVETHCDSASRPPLLEPSQASSLPKHSATDSSAASSAVVETQQLSSETLSSDESQDVLAVDKHTVVSLPLSSSAISTTVADGNGAPVEVKPDVVVNDSIANPDLTGESQTASPLVEQHPDPESVPDSDTAPTEPSQMPTHTLTELETPSGAAVPADSKTEDLSEDFATPGLPPLPSTPPSTSLSDIYADPPNGTEQNGNPVHGSSQKESVFMRLNNRIKALEMNMSLSGRYLEQLSQRYRKQMEEMQKAFNKTIIKLQNTSRIAEEQDQRQTESIQLLQAQLENMTQMVLNLSVIVSQLQNEVTDRQNYLLLCVLLSLCFALALFANRCRISITPPHADPEPPAAKDYTSCGPDRHFTSCDDSGLKRSASYPLINSFQVVATKDPESLHPEESQANKKRRRRKMKSIEEVETLTSCLAAPLSCNGAARCNGVPVAAKPAAMTGRLLPPGFRDSPSEGSSETSSHSDDPSFCGITTACSRICDGLTPPKTRAEKRALRRRPPKPACAVVDFLQAPHREKNRAFSISATQDIMTGKSQQSSGTFGRNIPLSGPV